MSRDYFIILVYCLVCEHYRAGIAQCPIRLWKVCNSWRFQAQA